MHKVSVTIPAAVNSLAPGLKTLGLAVSLHAHIELTTRKDDQLEMTLRGEGREEIPQGLRHPVIRAATRIFQYKEIAPAGLTALVDNRIPLNIGLDVEAAMLVGGMVAANNLTGGGIERDELIEMVIQMGAVPEAVVTSLLGGLNVCALEADGSLLYNSIEPPPLRVALIAPDLPDYGEQTMNVLPEQVPLADAIFNLSRLPFVLQAIMDADFEMLHRTLHDRLALAAYTPFIPGYEDVIRAGHKAGAAAITLAGNGPALIVFAPYNHTLIATAMLEAFQQAGVPNCRYWTLGLDAQGVTISVAE